MNVAVLPSSPGTAPEAADPLDHLADTLFHRMGSDGVYARTALYEDVVERLAALITRHREPDTEVMRFPPVMSRAQLEKSGYLKSFPNLLGCVCGLHGTEREINAAVSRFDAGGDWTTSRGGKGAHDSPGGGHAHAGCMIYLGDNWPDEYRGNAFMCNIHGNRINRDGTLTPITPKPVMRLRWALTLSSPARSRWIGSKSSPPSSPPIAPPRKP